MENISDLAVKIVVFVDAFPTWSLHTVTIAEGQFTISRLVSAQLNVPGTAQHNTLILTVNLQSVLNFQSLPGQYSAMCPGTT